LLEFSKGWRWCRSDDEEWLTRLARLDLIKPPLKKFNLKQQAEMVAYRAIWHDKHVRVCGIITLGLLWIK